MRSVPRCWSGRAGPARRVTLRHVARTPRRDAHRSLTVPGANAGPRGIPRQPANVCRAKAADPARHATCFVGCGMERFGWLVAALVACACGGPGDAPVTGARTDGAPHAPAAARAIARAAGAFCRGVCADDAACPQGLVCAANRCTKGCDADADCGPAPEWSCAPRWGSRGALVCTCEPSGAELCDGRDNDCNGAIDERRDVPRRRRGVPQRRVHVRRRRPVRRRVP